MSWNGCFETQHLHTADHPGLALSRVAFRMLRSIRMIRIDRMLLARTLDMVRDMALGMALDTATGVGMVRDIGVGREALPYHAVYPNTKADVKSLSSSGFSKWNSIFVSHEFRKRSM